MDMQVICQFGSPTMYKDGCFSKLEMRVMKGATVLIGVGIGIAFVEASINTFDRVISFVLPDISVGRVEALTCVIPCRYSLRPVEIKLNEFLVRACQER